ncbi:HAMP domain-containing protein [Vulgatibacter incomptus]|uniref:histidine kinase n=1 Tax=Vulgatibacter incomptus TaxID=1391653 RepID=A0A0K1PCX4_9BACT|nr:HAMP domain-containing protein [Vulgatibacter incomptus]AKU90974.1 Putative SigmaB asociated two-component system sensor protein [Vulgatibacter incomptus]
MSDGPQQETPPEAEEEAESGGLVSIRDALRAAALGDFSVRLPVDGGEGLHAEVARAFNALAARNERLVEELEDVCLAVGTEGKLGARADDSWCEGGWTDAVDSVNRLIDRLTSPMLQTTRILGKIAKGDLSERFDIQADGDVLALKKAVEATADQLRSVSAEVIRVAREVGVDGKLGAQAHVSGVSGPWRELVDGVNLLASNLTVQVRDIAQIATAIASGDLSQKITVEAKGDVADLKNTMNAMVDQLRTFADEVTRVAREVGTEGKLGGQARVPGVAGTWKELTESVNTMASNLTSQVRGIVAVVTAVAEGDLSRRLVLKASGEIEALADTINGMTDNLKVFAEQVTTVAREVGMEGQLGGQASVPGAAGTWKDLTENVNMLAGNLTAQVRNIALVTTAVAKGDLSRKITVEAKGEIETLKETINGMVEQLRTFASEVTRVAKEVGTDGQLGGQAEVPGVSGTWQGLTENVNIMAANLTDQVRGIGRVVTAVANGDLSKRLILVAKGEIATLADTINDMTDTLRTFADQVTSVAREVGIEGKLGGQASVPGAAGTWRDLTDNVNQLAANLTTQVRAIADVAASVTEGDLSRTIDVKARGEVLALKDTINQMIANLRDTTRENTEQDWLKTNLANFFPILQGQPSLESLTDQVMSKLTPLVGATHGAFYLFDDEDKELRLTSTYAYRRRKGLSNRFGLGDGLVGQCALEKKTIVVEDVPKDYVHIGSGLGESPPREIAVFPILYEEQVKGVIELGTFRRFTQIEVNFVEQLVMNLGLAINLIGASVRTEQLLEQLRGSNVELEGRRRELEDKAQELEARNRDVARASKSLEEKAEELAQVSKYKSQFLANMSHEIRTPLNSMLILAQMLAANEKERLGDREQEWASAIHAAGKELLSLINQVLDLSKIEAGRIEPHEEAVPIEGIRQLVERTFRPVALQKGLEFRIDVGEDVPRRVATDRQLLGQVLVNLLSNAFKFTKEGQVRLSIESHEETLEFAVSDTGIGIAPDQRRRIFEAFHQVDGSMTRRYEGTGLGLTISREYARLLGGDIEVESEEGKGSTFTLRLPLTVADRGEVPMEREPEKEGAKEPGEPAGMPAEAREQLQGKKVLVVEDDVRNLYSITALLESFGMEVSPASSARVAYRSLEEHPDFDVILMDLMMPEIDGYEATSTIREMPEASEIPIIILTAKVSQSDRERALEAGGSDFVAKPVEIGELATAILRNLGSE